MSLSDNIQQLVNLWFNRKAALQINGNETGYSSGSGFYDLLDHLLQLDKFSADKALKKKYYVLKCVYVISVNQFTNFDNSLKNCG